MRKLYNMRPDKQNKNAPNKDAFFVEKLNDISYGKPSAGLTPLKASQSFNPTNIRTNIEETKNRLSDLAEKWKGINSVKGFLTDLWDALGVLESNSGQSMVETLVDMLHSRLLKV